MALTTFSHLPPVQAGHLSRVGDDHSRGISEHDSRHPSLPPGGQLDSLHIQPWIGGPGATHLAFSLKEMSAVPGGEFRTFWEPEYKTSMPVGRIDTCSGGKSDSLGNLGTHHATGVWSERDTLAGPVLRCGV